MTDVIWIITSSVLILAVFAIRAIFGKKMSAGLRYALWGLVALRLLIPGTLFRTPVNVQSAAEKAEIVRDIETVRGAGSLTYSEEQQLIFIPQQPARPAVTPAETASPSAEPAPVVGRVVEKDATPERYERMQKTLKATDVLRIVWFTGMGLVFAYLVYVNVRFYLKLRDRRKLLSADSPCKVYSVDGLESSCLFLGSVYVSAEQADDPDRLNCVLAHELSHRRHCDGVFTVCRCAALVLHWYNPIVWAAAFASRQDSELFADAGAIKTLGEDEREDYGMTLIRLSARPSVRASIACTATTMANNKRALRQRVTNIARKRRMSAVIIAAVVLSVAAAAFFTFTGCKSPLASAETTVISTPEPTAEATVEPTAEPTADPTAEPTPEPTQEPMPEPDEQWLLDQAWPYAELANETYGSNYSRETARIIAYSEDEYYVSFTDGDGPSLSVHYRYDRSTEWQYAYNDFFPGIDPDLSGKSMDNPRRWMAGEEFTVTYEDLGAAGYTPDSSANDYVAVARWIAGEMAKDYRNAPENNCYSCIEADPGEPSFYAIPVIPGDTVIMHTRLYCLPRDVNVFLEAALDLPPSIAGADEAYPGRVKMGLISINITPTDGGWRCSIGYNVAGEALEGYMVPEEDAMSELIWRTDYLIEHDKDDIYISWHYIRYLYGMDWDEFGRHYTPAQWERIAEIMRPKAVGYSDWEQLRMDMHVMLGCENAPEGWWKGLSALLNEQNAYDPALFAEALSYLNDAQLEKVQSIMDRFPAGNTQD